MEEVIIRKAKSEDMVHVYNMIKELADFENMPDGPKIDYKVLQRDGFETDPPAFMSLVAELKNEIVGYALYYYTYSTWKGRAMFLEDLFVKQSCRQRRIGSKLFKSVAKECVNLKCSRLDFQVLSWNKATSFYEKHHAKNLTTLEQWNAFRVDEDGLQKLIV